MSNTSITNVEITDTFQVWISKTNEIIDLANENVMLAGPGGFTISGNSTLDGIFTANTLNAGSGRIDNISAVNLTRAINANDAIVSNSPIRINSSVENIFTLQSTAGNRPIFRMTNGGNSTWEVGHGTTAGSSPFTIRTPGAPVPQFTVGQNGLLTVDSIQTKNISIVGEGDTSVLTVNITGDVTGNVTGNVTGQVSDISNHTTNSLAEGSANLYFTTARARSAISAGTGVTINNGQIAIGQAVNTNSNVTFTKVNIKAATNGNDTTYIEQDVTSIGSIRIRSLTMFSNNSRVFSSFGQNETNLFGRVNILKRDNGDDARLEVKGDVEANLFIGRATSANYADLAEKFVPDKKYPIGTVVYIGGDKEITSSITGCKAIGVISEFPALMMNAGQKDGVYVALKGRVPVFVVDNVKKGDILVPGDNGKAAKGNISDPNVLGIALADSKDKKTEILVL